MESTESQKKQDESGKVLSVFGIIACILLVPILAVNILLIVQSFTSDSSELPNIGGYFPLMVQSGSMSDAIEVGDLIIVHTADNPDKLAVGDIITFWDNEPGGTLVTHRIIEVTKDDDGKFAYRTKGDANNTHDPGFVYPSDIVGTYNTRIPGLGNVALFMQTIPGLIVCVLLPLVLFVVYDVIRRRQIEKSNRQETDALLAELEQLKKEQAEKTENSKKAD